MTRANVEIEWGNIELPGVSDEKLFNTNWHRKAAMDKVNKNRPLEVQLKKSKTIKKQFEDPTYKELRSLIIKNVTKTDEWKERHANGIKFRQQNGWAEKNLAARKTKSIQTPYGQFDSKKEAVKVMTDLGIGNANGKLSVWLKSKPDEYYYLDK